MVSSPPPRWPPEDSSFSLPARSSGTSPVNTSTSSPQHCELSPALPSLVLTRPTPNVPGSPVFVPHSPITFSKFLSASSDGTHLSPSLPAASMVPALPRCEKCGLTEFESGSQCKECEEQWLACKVWYQANDGGRRRRLTEPYIKPAESNSRNRAMMGALGIPGGSPSAMGLGIQFETRQRPARALRRFSHLRPSKTMSMSKALGNVAGLETPIGDTVVSFLKHAMTRVQVLVTDHLRDDPRARFANFPCAPTRQVDQTMISWSRPNRCQRRGCNQSPVPMLQSQRYPYNTSVVEQIAGYIGYFMLRA